jgi:hypothetical protein
MIAALLVELLVHDASLAATVLLRPAKITQTTEESAVKMKLSAPTTPVFLISLIVGIVGILVAQGVVPDFGVRGFWLLALGFILLALANLMKGL